VTPAAARFLELTGATLPVVQAPMANFAGIELAIAAIGAGAVGSLPCAMLMPEQAIEQARAVRAAVTGPLNLNFFCHHLGPAPDESGWRALLAPFYADEEVAPPRAPAPLRRPFDAAMAEAVEAIRPEIVSFHFGLPEPALLDRVRATGARIFGNATNGLEAGYLIAAGCDAIVAQGFEAGGHAGYFLTGHRPVGTAALVHQIAVMTAIPVIAAGGITDAAAARAMILLGAGAVQVGTGYLLAPEAWTSAVHRACLANSGAEDSVFTNLFSGRLARGLRNRLIEALGAEHGAAPPFPYASTGLAPLRAKAEADGRGDYSPLWAGQGAGFAVPEAAAAITRRLGEAALEA